MDYAKDFEDRKLDTKYGKIHYKHHSGSSRSIILIHGLASSTKTWSRMIQYLPGNLNLYLIDLLGHGESDAPDIEYSVHMQVEVVKFLVKDQKLGEVCLFGHSYGGWVSAVYAKDNPTSRLVIEDSAGLEEFYNEVKGTSAREQYKKDVLEKAGELGANKHVIEAVLAETFIEGQLEEKDLRAINTPTLIIWGAEDAVIDVKYAKIFQNEIKGSKLSIIAGSKHTPHYVNPEEVSRIFLEFIK